MANRFDIHPELVQGLNRLDVSETLNLRRALEHVRAQTYDKKYPEFKGRSFVPVDNSVPTGAASVAFDNYVSVGEAAITSDYGTEAPTVGASSDSASQLIRGIQTKYSFSLQELRAASHAGSELPTRKANYARRAIEQVHDTVLLLGDTTWGLTGLFLLSGTNTYTVPSGAAGSQAWANKTSDEVLVDLNGIVNRGINQTNGVEVPDTIGMPATALQYIKSTRMGDGIDGTIYDFFMKTNTHITSIIDSIKLESNAGWTGRRMLAYKKSADALAGVIPQEFEQLAPQHSGFMSTTFCHSRTGGVQLFLPLSVTYGDQI